MIRTLVTFLTVLVMLSSGHAAEARSPGPVPAAERMDAYLPMLRGKRVALLINQTALVGKRSLLDTLISRDINVTTIFVPEHGFRGTADAGAHVRSSVDDATGLPVVSLYGNNKKATAAQLAQTDVVVYDLQDVGTRFYTYISSLEYMMEACAENNKALIVLDRPNPNGHFVDGPILESGQRSFVGMQPIPIVYGMTVGEYARMLKGEAWVKGAKDVTLKVITCDDYDHNTRYELPVAPSPNLQTPEAIALYPSLCLFEGTVVSVGRGTNKPFEQWGHPAYKGKSAYSFTPRSRTGATAPPYEGKACYGLLLSGQGPQADAMAQSGGFSLKWLIQAYQWYPEPDKFFNNFFEKLAGTKELRSQIRQGMSEEQIRKSWQPGIEAFKKIRKKYLLYPDFE